ncbi:hypothetical protein ACOMHN_058698 [Nucella lapillus]
MSTCPFSDYDRFNFQHSHTCQAPTQDMSLMISANEVQTSHGSLSSVVAPAHLETTTPSAFLATAIDLESYPGGLVQCLPVGGRGADPPTFLPSLGHGGMHVGGSDASSRTVAEQIHFDKSPVKPHFLDKQHPVDPQFTCLRIFAIEAVHKKENLAGGGGTKGTAESTEQKGGPEMSGQTEAERTDHAAGREMEKELQTMRSLETELHRVTSERQELEVALIHHGLRLSTTEGSPVTDIETILPFCIL